MDRHGGLPPSHRGIDRIAAAWHSGKAGRGGLHAMRRGAAWLDPRGLPLLGRSADHGHTLHRR